MALQKYPNRNASIEKRWNKDINRRWHSAWQKIVAIPLPEVITNLSTSEAQLIQFYIDQVYRIVEEEIAPATWQNEYQRMAYERGMVQSKNDLLSILSGQEATAAVAVLYLDLNFSEPHRVEFSFLADRANEKLAGYIRSFLTDLTGIVRDNIGLPISTIRALVKDRFFRMRKDAKRIATTEVNQAAQRAALIRSMELQQATGIQTDVRWVTAKDNRVRHLHAGWHGKIFTREQASRNMQISPWNCRCKLHPVVKTRVPARTNARFAKERKALLLSQEK